MRHLYAWNLRSREICLFSKEGKSMESIRVSREWFKDTVGVLPKKGQRLVLSLRIVNR